MVPPPVETHSCPSYSQAGEDRILHYLFESIGTPRNLRYVDIGAAFPTGHNNTYLFYTLGGQGVLVEADPKYLAGYREVRPRDAVEHAAIVPESMARTGSVTFYAVENAGWSTVSQEHLEVAAALNKGKVQYSLSVRCLTINELLGRHFPDGKFDILSMDIEGVDEQVLAELDFTRFSPTAIVVESQTGAVGGSADHVPYFPILRAAGYELFASSFINYIFVSVSDLKRMRI